MKYMKNLTKLIVIAVFVLFAFGFLVGKQILSDAGARVSAQAVPTPAAANTNTANTNAAANTNARATVNANAAANASVPAANANANTGDKSIPKQFTLGKDSISEHGEVAFNHDSHAFMQYSEDGKSVVGCAVCHHTDQPKSALKPPLLTSERDATLTLDVWKQSSQKVQGCRVCHFQDGNVPDGKTMPVIAEMEIKNEEAYHRNCNVCHDAAVKLRPDLKKKTGFATSNDCFVCHKKNS